MKDLTLIFKIDGKEIALKEGDVVVDKYGELHIVHFGTTTHTTQGHGECSTEICCGLYFGGWGRMEGIKKL